MLDIKEAHGVDVDQTNKRLKRSNIALGGAAFASIQKPWRTVVTVLLTILLPSSWYLAIDQAIVFSVTRLSDTYLGMT